MGIDDVIAIIVFIFLVIGMTYLGNRMTRTDYYIEEDCLVMKVFCLGIFPITMRLKLALITEAHEIALNQLFSSLLISRFWPIMHGKFARRLVVIKRKGIFDTIVISPKDASSLVEALRTRISQ